MLVCCLPPPPFTCSPSSAPRPPFSLTTTSRRIVKLCLRYGIEPNARNYVGETVISTIVRMRPYAKQLELIE